MLFDTPLLNLSSTTPSATASPSAGSSKKRPRASSTSTSKPTSTPSQPTVDVDKLLKQINKGDKGGPAPNGGQAKQGGGGGQGKAKKQKKDNSKQPAKQQDQQPDAGWGARPQGKGQADQPEGGKKLGKRAKKSANKAAHLEREKERSTSPAVSPSALEAVTLTPGMVLHRFAAPTQSLPSPSAASTVQAGKKGGSVQDKLRAQLAGGKFRMLNEQLYTTSGGAAYGIMQEEGAFDDYHTGFRSQAATWPVHPLALIAQSLLSSLAPNSLIADFGCGDAALARTLVPSSSPSFSSALPPIPSLKLNQKTLKEKRLKVLSFDLVSQSSYVVEAECSSVPLPGGTAGGEVVDSVVCCLSLMGTDWVKMIREARRVLREGGVLKIAEVTSRFTSVDDFVKLLGSLGFSLSHKDDSNTHFLLLDFTKTGGEGEAPAKVSENTKKAEKLLGPCIYKRR
ncbi:hypothetical protein JCM11641_005804 [Rhodosporidiobolus odoratus]